MSDYIEVDGEKYFHESYLQLANENSKRRGAQRDHYKHQVDKLANALRKVLVALPNIESLDRMGHDGFAVTRQQATVAVKAAMDGITQNIVANAMLEGQKQND